MWFLCKWLHLDIVDLLPKAHQLKASTEEGQRLRLHLTYLAPLQLLGPMQRAWPAEDDSLSISVGARLAGDRCSGGIFDSCQWRKRLILGQRAAFALSLST